MADLATFGRKLQPSDITTELASLAHNWVSAYADGYPFLCSMRALAQKGPLTIGQTKGVLNCLRRDVCALLTHYHLSDQNEADQQASNPHGDYLARFGRVTIHECPQGFATVMAQPSADLARLDFDHWADVLALD